LITKQVRAIQITRDNPAGGDPEIYEVCVEATPAYHEAHADIYSHPSALSKNAKRTVFRYLKEELASLAEWEPGFAPSYGEG
jgi:hypothetical protein